jgi:high affinity choline transporter 7
MAVNISGLISVIVFYILILAIGIWAARKTKKANNEDLMLAGRDIGHFICFYFVENYVKIKAVLRNTSNDLLSALRTYKLHKSFSLWFV